MLVFVPWACMYSLPFPPLLSPASSSLSVWGHFAKTWVSLQTTTCRRKSTKYFDIVSLTWEEVLQSMHLLPNLSSKFHHLTPKLPSNSQIGYTCRRMLCSAGWLRCRPNDSENINIIQPTFVYFGPTFCNCSSKIFYEGIFTYLWVYPWYTNVDNAWLIWLALYCFWHLSFLIFSFIPLPQSSDSTVDNP